MSVASALNLTREAVQAIIVEQWPGWAARLPALLRVDHPADLDRWLRDADPAAADDVLGGLAQLAAADGGDDVDAAKVLAWVLLPAACRVAGSFTRVADIDEHVAAQLWIEVRSFSWQTTSRVAANIARNLRKHLSTDLSELPAASLLATAQADAGLVVALARQYGLGVAEDGPSPMDELLSVLEWGCRRGLITSEDRMLLLDMIAAAADDPAWHRSGAALLGDKVSDSVGTHWGISGRTVRRRAAASISALAQVAAGQRQAGIA